MGASHSCLSRSRRSKRKHYSQELLNNNAININQVSEDELLFLPGVTRQLAKNLIDYRQTHHGFQQINELLQVPGITSRIFKKISGDITVNQNSTLLSLAALLSETVPIEFQRQILSSRRSAISNNVKQTMFRCASWNLQRLTYDKVKNFGVREVICRIILEHNISLIAVQDIVDPQALQAIVDELNQPIIPVVKSWSIHRPGKWKCVVSGIARHSCQEYFGFVYNESIGMEFIRETLLPLDQHRTRFGYLTVFRMRNQMEFVFVNLHLETRESNEAKSFDLLIKTIEKTVETKHVILFGTFNMIPTATPFQPLIQSNYSYVNDRNTDIHFRTPHGTTCADNIWLSADVKALRTENSGVVRDHLTNLWIPSGWQWYGFASEHCPVWIELDLS